MLAFTTCLVAVGVSRQGRAAPGALDVDFGSGGTVITWVGGTGLDLATDLVVQPDGKLVAAATTHSGTAGADFALVRWNQDGTLDTTFGGGIVVLPVGSGRDEARALVLQDDGKLVVAGASWDGAHADFALIRCNADGSRDTTFGSGGTVRTPFDNGAHSEANALALRPDGYLVAAGWSATGTGSVMAVARYDSSGRPDPSFNGDGKVMTGFDGASNARAMAVIVQPDRKIVTAGYNDASGLADFALVRFDAQGRPDADFSGNGKVTTRIGNGDDVALALLLSDGKLVAGGYSAVAGNGLDFALARYESTGRPDAGFDLDGMATTRLSPGADRVRALVLQPDGRVVAAGEASVAGGSDFALARYEVGGTLDPTFGSAGTVVTQVGPGGDGAYAVLRQRDGRLVAAGWSSNGNATAVALARYLGDEWCGNGSSEGGEQCDLGAASGTPHVCCTASCAVRAAGQQCRPAAGACDLVETCDGVAAGCPADAFAPAGVTCRPVLGDCDLTDFCSGSSPDCPDVLAPPTGVCRPSAGACDVVETCSGTLPSCPDDAYRRADAVCRVARDVCDAQEVCTGLRADCPADAVLPPSSTCRAAAGPCDIAEQCDGVDVTCPPDARQPPGTMCRAPADVCDVAETCPGGGTACPSDAIAPPGTACRPAKGSCDAVEGCSGTGTSCPSDSVLPASIVCRPEAGACDVAEQCTGTGPACPEDSFLPSTVVCRTSAGVCDVAETCSGSGPACPRDAFQPPTVVCRERTGDCDLPDACTGHGADCVDGVLPAGASCPDDANACTADVCDGVEETCTHRVIERPECGSCDVDVDCDDASPCTVDACVVGRCVNASGNRGTTCRPGVARCDPAEACDGSSPECPADMTTSSAGDLCDDGHPETGTDACTQQQECRGVATRIDVDPEIPVPPDQSARLVTIPVTVEVPDAPGGDASHVSLQGRVDCFELPRRPQGCARPPRGSAGPGGAAPGYQLRLTSRYLPVTRRVTRTFTGSPGGRSIVDLPLNDLGKRLFAKLQPDETYRELPVRVHSAIREGEGRILAVFRTLLERRRPLH